MRLFTCTILVFLTVCMSSASAQTGTLTLNFVNTVNGKPIIPGDSIYTNPFGESYNVTKLRYYVSHIGLPGTRIVEEDPYHLVNIREEVNSFSLPVPVGDYEGIEFTLGVDSLANCSGAQTGALDPMNDMFWTWNSGYVIFKLEGTSPSSTADLNRIEHHIGGYKAENNVSTRVNLKSAAPLKISAGTNTTVFIEADLNKYWKSRSDTKISDAAVCMTTGALARKLAQNLPYMFSVKRIETTP